MVAPKFPKCRALNPSISDDEIREIMDRAQSTGDRYTVAEARRALKGALLRNPSRRPIC